MSRIVRRPFRGQGGFSLVEIMVVVGLMAILMALAGPRIWSAIMKVKGHQATSDLAAMSDVMEQYLATTGKYPRGTSAEVQGMLLGEYLDEAFTFRNAYDQPYLYLHASDYLRYILIDLNQFDEDMVEETEGQQVIIVCGATTVTVTVSDGDPETEEELVVASVPKDDIASCTMPVGSNFGVVTS